MSHITGDLGFLSLPEILSGAEILAKTGVIRIEREGVEKKFFFHEGDVVFVTSTRKGERFGEFLSTVGCLDAERLQVLLEEDRCRGGRFKGDLLKERVFEKSAMEKALSQLVILALAEALSWSSGTVEFSSELPSSLRKAPVPIRVPNALEQAQKYQKLFRSSKDASEKDV